MLVFHKDTHINMEAVVEAVSVVPQIVIFMILLILKGGR